MDTKAIFVGFTVPPSLDDIQEIADAILDELPESLRKHIAKLKIQVEDFPDAFIEQEMEIETPFDLMGCYQSSSPANKNNRDDILYLYRRPILDVWAETGEDLARLVNRVMVQEIGHHFGHTPEEIQFYEEDMFGATVSNTGNAG